MTKERKKQVTLVVLLGVLAVVVGYDLKSSDSGSGLTNKPAASQTNAKAPTQPQPTNRKVLNSRPGPAGSENGEGYRPLPLYALEEQGSASDEAKRNIFVYYVPPPQPVVIPQGPPPTIALVSLSPDSVYARTGDFTLRVKGPSLPEDAKIFVNGQEQQTQFVNPNELTASVSKSRIAAQGKLAVEVKTPRGDFSNPLPLNVIEPPTPAYAYVGRIDDLVFLKSGDDRYAVRVGSVVDEKKASRWRVVSATDANVIVQDVMINVNHRLDMDLGQSASSGGQNQQSPLGNRVIRGRQMQPVEEGDDEELQQQLLEQEQMQQLQIQQQLQMQQQQYWQQQQLQMQQQPQFQQQLLQRQQQLQQLQQLQNQQKLDPQQERLLRVLEAQQRALELQQQRNIPRRPNRE